MLICGPRVLTYCTKWREWSRRRGSRSVMRSSCESNGNVCSSICAKKTPRKRFSYRTQPSGSLGLR